jgi:UDP-N-acetylmuramate: L-alanyl-gamma-D-glutamyl-meso-diaminopimelate ligase
MRIHLIAIGGAIMHQIAITMKRKGYQVTGSDDVIQEPSKSRLEAEGLMPLVMGFHSENITKDIDIVILGMHAKFDNPELTKAMELGVKVLSFPEFIYENCKDKRRVVIAGSHGKTSITSMIMHCLQENKIDFDYMVGSSVAGFEFSVKLSDAPIIILEGDEYLASPINKEPKFIYYKAHIACISGIEWDHINVFKTNEIYDSQFKKLVESMESEGQLFYYNTDRIRETISGIRNDIRLTPYEAIPYDVDGEQFYAKVNEDRIPLTLFGKHNMENIQIAKSICMELGMSEADFFKAISEFSGAGRRLELLIQDEERVIYKDFAHSPSKLQATVKAVKEKYPNRTVVACFELHTFSSLSAEFLTHYGHTMDEADVAIIFIDKEVVEKKGNGIFSESEIKEGFSSESVEYFTDKSLLRLKLNEYAGLKPVYLMMSSGTFGGTDLTTIGKIKNEDLVASSKSNATRPEVESEHTLYSLYETKHLHSTDRLRIRQLLSFCYLLFLLAPAFYLVRHRSTENDSLYNCIVHIFNFQVLSTFLLILSTFIDSYFVFAFWLAIGFNAYYTNKCIQQLNFKQALNLPSGFLAVFPRIDKS